jgi:hypothetical protein
MLRKNFKSCDKFRQSVYTTHVSVYIVSTTVFHETNICILHKQNCDVFQICQEKGKVKLYFVMQNVPTSVYEVSIKGDFGWCGVV